MFWKKKEKALDPIKLHRISNKEMDAKNYHTIGIPTCYSVYSNDVIRVYPLPEKAENLQVFYKLEESKND